jgi:DNA-binding transcriptional ArsR family regulator
MLYQRSLEIERRLETALELIRSGEYSTPMLAEKLGVSIPTVSRHVTALRERGYKIRSERREGGWRFTLDGNKSKRPKESLLALDERRF